MTETPPELPARPTSRATTARCPRRTHGGRVAASALAIILGAAIIAAGTGCAAQHPATDAASEAALESMQEWAALDANGQIAAIEADSRALGELLIEAAGLPELTGMSSAEIEASIPRHANLTGPAQAPLAPAPEAPVVTPPAESLQTPEDLDEMLEGVDLGGIQPENIDLGDAELQIIHPGASPAEHADPSAVSLATVPRADQTRIAMAGFMTDSASAPSTGFDSAIPEIAHIASGGPGVDVRGAGLNAARMLTDQLRLGLSEAQVRGQDYSTTERSDGWERIEGFKDGTSYSSIRFTDENAVLIGNSYETVDSAIQAEQLACPGADGKVDGLFVFTAGLTHTTSDGRRVKTQVEITLDLLATVDEGAWVVDASGEIDSTIKTGTPGDLPGELVDLEESRSYGGTLNTDYDYDKGAVKPVRSRVFESTGSKELGDLTRDVAAKIQQTAVQAAEAFWRSGACIEAIVKASPDKIARGGSSDLTVEAQSRMGGGTVKGAVAKYTGKNAGSVGGKVTKSGSFPTPARFTFTAEHKDGIANPEFMVTSRQGIGFGMGNISVGQSGWVIDATVADQYHHAVKCDGVAGEWSMQVTGPYGYSADLVFTMGEDLFGQWAGTVVGAFSYTGEVWFVEQGDGYVMHATGGDFDPMLPVRPATDGECD